MAFPGPQGRAWGPSTIYGNWRRGTGILNNELYVGRLVWNRQRYIKDPNDPQAPWPRPNPRAGLGHPGRARARIVDDALWQEVKERQGQSRRVVTCDSSGVRPERARRPAYLLSGLLKCGACGGGFSKVSQEHYGCSKARNRGTCANLLAIRRDVVEASVLSGLRTHLMHPDLVKEFVAEYQREINRMNAQVEETHARHKVELARGRTPDPGHRRGHQGWPAHARR